MIWKTQFVICILSALILAFQFYRAQNGWLRKLFIAYLISVAFVTASGLAAYILKMENDRIIMDMAFLPWSCSSIAFVVYLYRFHKRRVPEKLEPHKPKQS